MEAVGCHKKLLALGEREGTTAAEMASSYLAVAEWEMRGVARRVTEKEKGDWALASQYLEKVAQTNAPQRDKAEELLRELRVKEARLAAGL
jgi:anaphase-promoting complex subunit 8